MKTIIKILAVVAVLTVLALTACNGDKPKGQLKQGAMIYVNVKNGTLKSMDVRATDGDNKDGLLTPREIVETATAMVFAHPDGRKNTNISIAPQQKDVENARIKMWGEQVIREDGTLNEYFITLRDVRIVAPNKLDKDGKMIPDFNVTGYIPNEVMERAEKEIRKEYAAGNYDKVYKLFQDAYTATPINLEMWEALQKEGKQ
ncbi:hypothetical protein [uncultured Porphyromonas sp.]|uniref:hypothetical protein n=1 Tax=uncultured Porphyromonas sp. TaxID=159274 RepID=UPI002591C43C|nr:hypothetical protein [uncultured Porphyromonas sp.]